MKNRLIVLACQPGPNPSKCESGQPLPEPSFGVPVRAAAPAAAPANQFRSATDANGNSVTQKEPAAPINPIIQHLPQAAAGVPQAAAGGEVGRLVNELREADDVKKPELTKQLRQPSPSNSSMIGKP